VPFPGVMKYEFRVKTKNCETRWVCTYGLPLHSENRYIGFQGVMTDITQSKILQNMLLRPTRLAATGQLAASIAHEINSSLQAITLLLASIKKQYLKEKNLTVNIDIFVKEAFKKIRDTVNNLMDLNRPGRSTKQQTDVNQIFK